MHGMLFADRAIFVEFETVGVVALILETIVISVLALGALERDLHSRRFGSHWLKTPYKKITPLTVLDRILTHFIRDVNDFCNPI